MLVVNLFGAPGSGKSTGASYIFSCLKLAGINAELITEFAKDKVWEGTSEPFNNQAYLFGEQSYRISRCDGKVDAVVTDSPLPLSILYNARPEVYTENFNKAVMDVFNSYNNMSILLNRVKPYNPAGRHETEEESDQLLPKLRTLLSERGIEYEEEDGNIDGYNRIVDSVLAKLLV